MYVLFACLKFEACYISGQKGEIKVKNTISFLHTFLQFLLFFIKRFVFSSFSFLWMMKNQVLGTEY